MPTRVDIPVRIRANASAVRGDALAAALARALGPVLERAAATVPALEAGGSIARSGVTLTWGGEALERLGSDERRRAERIVELAIDRALDRFERTRMQAGALLGEPVAESIDLARYDAAYDLYDVPAYEGGGKKQLMRARAKDDVFEDRTVITWAPTTLTADDNAALLAVYAAMAETFAAPPGAWQGLIWHISGSEYGVWFQNAQGRWIAFRPHIAGTWQVSNGVYDERPGGRIVPGVAIARSVARFTHGSFDERADYVRAHHGAYIRHQFELDARKRKLTDAQIAAVVEQKFEIAVRNRASSLMHAGGIHHIVVDGKTYEMRWPESADPNVAAWLGDAVLLPVADITTIHERKKRIQKTDPNGGASDLATAETGTGTGKAGGTGTGGGAGTGTGNETQQFRGFPGYGAATGSIACEPFRDEPSLASFTAGDAADVRFLMAEIATLLDIPTCDYVANFCLTAAHMVGTRAEGISDAAAFVDARLAYDPAKNGNLGDVSFQPQSSPAIGYLRRVASAVPRLTVLANVIRNIYRSNPETIEDVGLWNLYFGLDFDETMRKSIAVLFGEGCRTVMLQLLRASALEIDHRRANIDLGVQIFTIAIRPQIQPVVELLELKSYLTLQRDIAAGIKNPNDEDVSGIPAGAGSGSHSWEEYLPPGDIVMAGKQVAGVRDKHGSVWTERTIDDAVAQQRGMVEEIEPLLKHVENIQVFYRATAAGPEALKTELQRLLDNMADENTKIRDDVADSWRYAFKLSRIDRNLPAGGGEAGIEFALQGVHLLSHQALFDAFEGDYHYGEGVNFLFSIEESLGILQSLLELSVLAIAAVLCPPLAFGLGVAIAGAHLYEAHEKMGVLDALFDPELVVSRAELELELFAAELGFALSIVPAVPGMARSVFKIGAAVAEEGAIAGARVAVTLFAEETMVAFRQALRVGLAKAIVKEYIKFEAIGKVMQFALAPVIQAKQDQIMRTGPVGGMDGAARLIAWYHRADAQP